MKFKLLIGLCLLLVVVTPFPSQTTFAAPSDPPAPKNPPPTADNLLTEISQAFNDYGQGEMGILSDSPWSYTIDRVFTSLDGSTAVIWLAPNDPQTGEKLATEPVLAIGKVDLQQKALGEATQWDFILQDSPAWPDAVAQLPAELLDSGVLGDADPTLQADVKGLASDASAAPLGGYYLPWAKGGTKHLSMGANHTSCSERCVYAFDFADGSMFPILAAKGGTVYNFKDSCANGDSSCTNSLILEDRSTNPVSYQIYLHLRQNSIASNLRSVGATVQQGQYLADADDTGFSTGNHLHFMVVTSLYYYATGGYYWGTSVDITFKDVSINYDAATGGGRPCTQSDLGYGKCQQYQATYTSGNQGANPPTGSLVSPASGTVVTAPTLYVSGYGSDDRGVAKMSILANYDGNWKEIGASQTSNPFVSQVDLCSANIPDGPLSLALRVWDVEGNQSTAPLGIHNILKDYACSPTQTPAVLCPITADQVALYSEPNLTGACQVYSAGDYANGAALAAVGDDNAASLQVGQNVSATLYASPGFSGRAVTFTSSSPVPTLTDRNLSDDLIGADQTSSLRVQTRSATPPSPIIAAVGSPTTNDSLVFSWTNPGGATKFYAKLTGPTSIERKYDNAVSKNQSWSVGTLAAGNYTLEVRGRVGEYNGLTHESDPATISFTVSPASLGGSSVSAPYSDDMESGAPGWTASGLWRLGAVNAYGDKGQSTAWVFNSGATYASSSVRSGDLTSPPIVLPASPASYLRFTDWYETESAFPFFDQRRLQISVDGGLFQDLPAGTWTQPLTDDQMGYWLNSPVIDLSSYAGKTVRIRFHFDAIDTAFNNYAGWAVDDVSISAAPPPSCNDTDSTAATATAISIGANAGGTICPAGDVDFYSFTTSKGKSLQIDVTAADSGHPLDPVLTLLDGDQASVISENDDVQPGIDSNSRVSFIVPADGTYYLKVRSFWHPGDGDPRNTYHLTITQISDANKPMVSLTYPVTNQSLLVTAARLTADAVDNQGGGGVKYVEFWVHDANWASGTWKKIGTDVSGADGWSIDVPADSLTAFSTRSFYARAVDWAGNQGVAAAWNVLITNFEATNWLYMPVIER